jgi:hypothetical protein
VNIEGFAIAPDSTCVDDVKQAIWSDDGIAAAGHEGHALYGGTFPCDLALGDQGAPATVDLGARGPGEVSVAKKGTLAVRGSGFEPGEAVRIGLYGKTLLDVLGSIVVDEFRPRRCGGDAPARRPARRPGDLAGRSVGHRRRRPDDHHTHRARAARCSVGKTAGDEPLHVAALSR